MAQFLPKGGNWPHAVLLESDGAEALSFAREAAARLLCPEGRENCRCGVCRRVREGIHPDVTVIDRGGKDIVVDDIRAMRQDAYVAPLEGNRKVYLILHAQDLNGAAQNAALKLLEEPPAGVFFVLLADSAMHLLETIRSRCVIFGAGEDAEEGAADEESAQLAASFAAAISSGSELALLEFCLQHEKLKRAELAAFFDAAIELLRRALRAAVAHEPPESDAVRALAELPAAALLRLIDMLTRRRRMNEGNVGAAHLLCSIPAEFFAG
ncbi:MAG: hypothetical protein E7458_07085 [Ruminococcaceae bacterium]|nr:hypothetical protein [Oscillospiraceae bacterium]